jgi:hypothetical protein
MAIASLSPTADKADKFRDLARELECDEDEAAFDERLKALARSRPPGTREVKSLKVGVGYYGLFTPSVHAAIEPGPVFPTEIEAKTFVAEQKRLAHDR